jgi:hypothetical protein
VQLAAYAAFMVGVMVAESRRNAACHGGNDARLEAVLEPDHVSEIKTVIEVGIEPAVVPVSEVVPEIITKSMIAAIGTVAHG